MWGVEKCGRVYGVSVKCVGEGCGERNGGGEGKCVGVWGPNTLPFTSLTSPSPHPNTLSYISSHTSSPTPQHTFLHLSPHLPSPSQSVAKLPCDEVSVAKLLATPVPTEDGLDLV